MKATVAITFDVAEDLPAQISICLFFEEVSVCITVIFRKEPDFWDTLYTFFKNFELFLDPKKNDFEFKQKVKEAQKNSNTKCEFIDALTRTVYRTTVGTIFLALMLSISTVLIVVGAVNEINCRVEECLPYWMMGQGSAMFVRVVMLLASSRTETRRINKCKGLCVMVHILDIIIFLGLIAGSYFVFHIYEPDYFQEYDGEFCEELTYLFSFAVIAFMYAVIVLFIITSFCICLFVKVDE